MTQSVAPSTTPKRRPGRPTLPPEDRVKNRRSRLTLEGPIPEFIGYEDLKHLIKLYRGSMYAEGNFKLWVEDGDFPSYLDSRAPGTAHQGVKRRKYRWSEAKAWVDKSMIRAQPLVTHNDKPITRTAC